MVQKKITITANHPSLAGHFPTRPVVPGVVILDHLRLCIEQWKGKRIQLSSFSSIKFLSPVLVISHGESVLDVDLSEAVSNEDASAFTIKFSCKQNEKLIVKGQCQVLVERENKAS